jgi:hypothetical protein
MEGEIIHTQTISAQSQNEFLGDLELSDPESLEERGDGGDTLDSNDMNESQHDSLGLERDHVLDESIDDEDDDTNHDVVANNTYQGGAGALDGLEMSESEDEPPPESTLASAFEGPSDLFGDISDMSD